MIDNVVNIGEKLEKKAEKSEPRALSEVTSDYEKACQDLGAVEYQTEVYKSEAVRIKQAMLSLNREAAARRELDAKASKEAETAKVVEAVEAVARPPESSL